MCFHIEMCLHISSRRVRLRSNIYISHECASRGAFFMCNMKKSEPCGSLFGRVDMLLCKYSTLVLENQGLFFKISTAVICGGSDIVIFPSCVMRTISFFSKFGISFSSNSPSCTRTSPTISCPSTASTMI